MTDRCGRKRETVRPHRAERPFGLFSTPCHPASSRLLGSAPSNRAFGPAPAPTRFVRSRPRTSPAGSTVSVRPCRSLAPRLRAAFPSPQHNRGADAALPAAPSGTTTHAPRPDPLAARASPRQGHCDFSDLFSYHWLRPRYSISTLSSYRLFLHSIFRIFGSAEDTPFGLRRIARFRPGSPHPGRFRIRTQETTHPYEIQRVQRTRPRRHRLRGARRMGRPRHVPQKHRHARGTPLVRLLRRTSLGQRTAGHPPRHGPHDQGRLLPLQDAAGLPRPPQGGLGHARPPGRTGRREEARHHEGGYRPHDLDRGVQPRLPRGGDGVHGRVGGPHTQDGLLGQHEGSLHHLRQQIRRVAVVAAQAALRQGAALQGLHDPALLAGRRHGPLDPRAQPAGLLPRREGHDRRGAVPHPRSQARDGGLGHPLLPRMDHHAVDPALEHGAVRRPEDRLRGRAHLQPLHGREGDGRAGRGAAPRPLQQEGRRHGPRRLRARRQAGALRGGRPLQGPRAGGHGLRAAAAVGEARRDRRARRVARRLGEGVPRHRGRLRDHRGRYGYRPHRADVRRRRRLRGARRGYSVALHDQQAGRDAPDGRPHGQVLPARGARRALRRRVRGPGVRRVRRPLGEERLRPAVHRRRQVRRGGRSRSRVARRLHLHEAQGRRPRLPDREARPQLPPLLAHGQAGALLPARLVVHPLDGLQGAHDRAQPHDPLEARVDRHGPLRQVARKPQRLEPLAFALLGARRCRSGPRRTARSSSASVRSRS